MLLFAGAFVQGQVNDAQLWLKAGIEKRITPDLAASFTEEVRLVENITEAGLAYTDLGISYRLGKRFKLSAAYRFSKKRRLDDSYESFNGFYFDASYREKISALTSIIRLRFQSRYGEVASSPEAAIPRDKLRARLTLKYDLRKKYEPYVYAEAFFRLNDPARLPFNQIRLCGGVEYTFNRMHMIDLYYLVQREYNVNNPETEFVAGVSYYFTF
jgi:hypothetical protein